MLVSTRGRYALCMLVDLAEHDGDRYIPLCEIAARQQISGKYLECILKCLVKENILVGCRGKCGGYRLGRPASEITVADVLRLTEGSLVPVSCMAEDCSPCPDAASCRTLPMWQRFSELANDFFDSISIADLMQPGQAAQHVQLPCSEGKKDCPAEE